MNFDFNKTEARMREICQSLKGDNVENREALEQEFNSLKREYEMETAMAKAQRENKPAEKSKGEQFREALDKVASRQQREFVFGASASTSHSVLGGGAVNLTVHDVIGTLNEGLNLPAGLTIATGVTGNELWPVSINDIEMQEVGENGALNDTTLDLTSITVTPKRAGLPIDISNKAIDQASFDVMGFVRGKYSLALKKYLAKKIYSQANWDGIKGPFAGLAKAGDITIGNTAYKSILEAVAVFADKGFDTSDICIVMDAATEAKLKATLKSSGVGGYVIENGKCAGYNYVVSHYINTVLGGDAKTADTNTTTTQLYGTTKKYLGFGMFNYLAVQQHGEVRMTMDNSSKAVANTNTTNITLNTEYSITDLSVKLNGGNATQAFALYELA